jgi:glycosyltransferase involved in cell wall biosynthesis
LLEYGAAGLPVVVTDVGQCSEVVDKGRAGILAEPSNPRQLAEGILALLSSTELRRNFGEELRKRVLSAYSPGPIIKQIADIYRNVLNYQSGSLEIGSNGSRIPA